MGTTNESAKVFLIRYPTALANAIGDPQPPVRGSGQLVAECSSQITSTRQVIFACYNLKAVFIRNAIGDPQPPVRGSGQLVAECSSQITSPPQVSYLTIIRARSTSAGCTSTPHHGKDYTAFGEISYTTERTAGLGYSGSGGDPQGLELADSTEHPGRVRVRKGTVKVFLYTVLNSFSERDR
jgi:hypothetical protein